MLVVIIVINPKTNIVCVMRISTIASSYDIKSVKMCEIQYISDDFICLNTYF